MGPNFSAVGEMARTADDVVGLGLEPIVGLATTLNWDKLVPSSAGADLSVIESVSPTATNAAYAVQASAERLQTIDASRLLPQISEPLIASRAELSSITGALTASADAAKLLPEMLGSQEKRHYLLMIQNNAETRASGGIPGALAALTVEKGKLSLGAQSSAGDLGIMTPVLPVDPQQRQIFSTRLGKYMQDVNLTPDFPTAASTAKLMWERKTGQRLDGVLSVDPVVLSYILRSTGPVSISGPELQQVKTLGLPVQLTGNNVVQTLLSEVYAKIADPKLQDAYFAGVAREIFSALSDGKAEAQGLISGLGQGAQEGRVLVWSSKSKEQAIIERYQVGGSVTGPSVSPAQFGVYFNDGTGAKMDFYVKRSVQLVKQCEKDGYEHTLVRVVSTNTAPVNAATALPAYVTGDGNFGVPAGSVQTNVLVYGPAQAAIETTDLDGQRVPFASHFHATRPVGIYAVTLAPGESKVLEFTFGKIVQHTEPNVVVTPSVQPVKDVTLPTESTACDGQ
jgi:hypothetical protein